MKINKLITKNFMGLKGEREIVLNKTNIMCQPNGTGKTSFINAIRFALTGLEPEGEIITKGCNEMAVSVILDDGNVYTRERITGKPSKCKINGKATTQTSMNEAIESLIGIPLESVKITSSAELIAKMKSQEFGEFILSYIPETLDTAKIIEYIPDATLGMMDTLTNMLPVEAFGISEIDDLYDFCFNQRKQLKISVAEKETVLKNVVGELPSYTKAQIEEYLRRIEKIENGRAVYATKLNAYNQAVANKERQKKLITDLEAQVRENAAEKQLDSVRDKLVEESNRITESNNNARKVYTTLSNSLDGLKISLENINKPICPLSDKLVCTTDKSKIKGDLEQSIKETEDGIKIQKIELNKLEKEREDVAGQIRDFDKKKAEYEKKIALLAQLEKAKEVKIDVPEKPADIDDTDYSGKKKTLLYYQQQIAMHERTESDRKILAAQKEELADYDALVQALAPKGIVKKKIMEYYTTLFQDTCNTKAKELTSRPLEFKFVAADGIQIFMNRGNGFLKYESLSGGEKSVCDFIILDLLNSLCGMNILIMDELSVLDRKSFKELLDLCNKSTYDHIIMACVDHDDTVETIKSLGISTLVI